MMQEIEAANYDPIPAEYTPALLDPIYPPETRVLAWVLSHTVCFPYWSAYCTDEKYDAKRPETMNKRNFLPQDSCVDELNKIGARYTERHGGILRNKTENDEEYLRRNECPVVSKSCVSRMISRWRDRGIIRTEKVGEAHQSKIFLCGKVRPDFEAIAEHGSDDSLRPALAALLNQRPKELRQEFRSDWKALKVEIRADKAAAIRACRDKERELERDLLAKHGISKKGRRYIDSDQQLLEFADAAVAGVSSPNGSSSAQPERKIVQQPETQRVESTPPNPACTSNAIYIRNRSIDKSKGVVVVEEPPAAAVLPPEATVVVAITPPVPVPAFRDFRKLYPQKKLDEARARDAFNNLSPIDKAHCIRGLELHVTCERWIRSLADDAGFYIPLASNFIKRREYHAEPPPHIDTNERKPVSRTPKYGKDNPNEIYYEEFGAIRGKK